MELTYDISVICAAGLFFGQPGLWLHIGAWLGLMSNVVHQWAHTPIEQLSPIVKALQSSGLVLNPRHHRLHHNPPHLVRFCIFNGILGPVLDAVGFWYLFIVCLVDFIVILIID